MLAVPAAGALRLPPTTPGRTAPATIAGSDEEARAEAEAEAEAEVEVEGFGEDALSLVGEPLSFGKEATNSLTLTLDRSLPPSDGCHSK